jgi:hypothetical protein
MFTCPLRNKIIAAFLCALTISVILPFSFGGASVALPIGKTASSGTVSIAGSTAPSGTAVFSGERVVAQGAPALIALRQGGSILLGEGAAATFSQNGGFLVIQAYMGTLSFNFLPGGQIRIQAGSRSYVASESGSVGEIAVTPEGGSAVSVASGSLTAFDSSASAAQLQNKGNLTKGSDSFTDPNAHWASNSLQGGVLDVGGRQYKIVSNTEKTIRIQGTFALDTGSYNYSIIIYPSGRSRSGMSTRTKAIIGVAAAGGAAGGIIAWQMGKSNN